ncbi:dolichyl-P-Man:Man(7)GlcNAc(2)-PP-dolichol alpha-1,6-mannosyltransferase [Podochytrium sp. JEL0797]|nr:dolichyl-P-Man:Man(7)GlcNAc(2)-PP-dolichol alpha-1,6-mannosyltransferase [Podochytrium sp. JEL0797]
MAKDKTANATHPVSPDDAAVDTKPHANASKDETKPQSPDHVWQTTAYPLTDDSPDITQYDLIAVVPGGLYDLLILAFMIYAVFAAPFTKVEESFNVQAIHDLMLMPVSKLAEYDHMFFPGVVPRTFLGPLLIKLLSFPAVALFTSDGTSRIPTSTYLTIARITLALLTVHSLRMLRQSIARVFGHTVSAFFALVCGTQFHLVFWGSRFIPNTFALIGVTYGCAAWVGGWKPVTREEVVERVRERERIFGSPPQSLNQGKSRKLRLPKQTPADAPPPAITALSVTCIAFLLSTALIFRLELLAFLAPLLLQEIFVYKHIKFLPAFLTCVVVGIVSLALTVPVDTFFWNTSPTLMWPEFSVFTFNILEGRHEEYGLSPPLDYFTTLLPRIAPIAIPLALHAGLTDARCRRLLTPATVFVAVMSCIGHKEWRFVFPIVPLVNAAAAVTLTRVHRLGLSNPLATPKGTRDVVAGMHTLFAMATPVALCVSAVFTLVGVTVSALNYPGGVALEAVHQFVKVGAAGEVPRVHLDVYTCQTGASRFGEEKRGEGWVYSKEEGVDAEIVMERGFTHLLTSTPEVYVGADWQERKEEGGELWEVAPGYIHGLKSAGVEFGELGLTGWAWDAKQKLIKGDLRLNVQQFVYGVKLPIEVVMEPKIYLVQRRGWGKEDNDME